MEGMLSHYLCSAKQPELKGKFLIFYRGWKPTVPPWWTVRCCCMSNVSHNPSPWKWKSCKLKLVPKHVLHYCRMLYFLFRLERTNMDTTNLVSFGYIYSFAVKTWSSGASVAKFWLQHFPGTQLSSKTINKHTLYTFLLPSLILCEKPNFKAISSAKTQASKKRNARFISKRRLEAVRQPAKLGRVNAAGWRPPLGRRVSSCSPHEQVPSRCSSTAATPEIPKRLRLLIQQQKLGWAFARGQRGSPRVRAQRPGPSSTPPILEAARKQEATSS